MKVTIEKDTTKNPLTMIGQYAGECWGAPVGDPEVDTRRGVACLKDGHGRTLEFPQIYVKIANCSARFMRELYTHIGGSPSRLQASTRYIDYQKGFGYIVPKTIAATQERETVYRETMDQIISGLQKLDELGVPREDCANLLPLGMESVMVLRTNLRMLIDMSRQRMCMRAYWEFRDFMDALIAGLNAYDEQYAYITDQFFGAKCDFLGYCPESDSCGRWERGEQTRRTPPKR